jgi:hypothetical protein
VISSVIINIELCSIHPKHPGAFRFLALNLLSKIGFSKSDQKLVCFKHQRSNSIIDEKLPKSLILDSPPKADMGLRLTIENKYSSLAQILEHSHSRGQNDIIW